MHPPSSSTSNSKQPRTSQFRQAIIVTMWTMVFLAAADVGLSVLLAIPAQPDVEPGALQQFFDYGRSIEGKLRRMVGDSDDSAAPLAQAGWIAPPPVDDSAALQHSQGLRIAAYGMSFTFRFCRLMQEIEPAISLQLRGGPAAPLSHSYAMYREDRGHVEADVVVLGVLASSLPALQTMTHATWNFEAPAPYTYPRFVVEGGDLHRIDPQVSSLAQLRGAMDDPTRWNDWRRQLRLHDRFYSDFVFAQNALDGSSLGRIVRRSLAQRHQRNTVHEFHTAEGFRQETGIIEVAALLLASFAESARRDGAIPIVLLIHDQGYSDHLHRALAPALNQHQITHLSTHELVNANDPANFLADGHFTLELERRVARELLALIQAQAD